MAFHSAGIKIGHATLEKYHTGCTVFLCPPGTVGSVDVRGPAPGSRESALLQLDKPISYLNAVVLTGGSAFGLAAADGVMRYCAEHNIGHQTPVRPIPIVPAAVVYDLFMGDGRHLPDADLGYAAAVAAAENNDAQGNIGAGAGVSVGKWAGFENAMKSGFGVASFEKDGLVVMATAVTNAVGDVVNKDGTVLAGARSSTGWMADEDPFRQFPARPPVQMTNTTLVVVGTNARLTKIEANRLAQRAHDGMAIAIRPVHTTHDGDTAFALATGQIDAGFDVVANIAVEMVSEAIRNSVRYAKTVGAWPGLAGEA